MFSTSDTIVAIATPPGRGGIGVVRLSGPLAESTARRLIDRRSPLAPRHATFATIKPAGPQTDRLDGAPIDQVIVTYFPSPKSYTGEDVVELSAHGSPVVLNAIVEAAMASGARLAEPGEFTLRAFLNGRVDLMQAEAVADLIEAVTPLQARVAFDQLNGTLTSAIATIDATLLDLVARLEASVDFPEEGYHFVDPGALAHAIDGILDRLSSLIADGRRGRLVRDGLQIAIVGPPNVGKSSLFNTLVGASRAIVTPHAGTTRDLVTETVDFDGLDVTLVDTAGLRETEDVIEAEGVRRSRDAAAAVDVVLSVLDLSRTRAEQGPEPALPSTRTRVIRVANKSDLSRRWSDEGVIEVSAATGAGLERLKTAITGALDVEWLGDRPALTNVRHLALLEQTHAALVRARAAALTDGRSLSEEFVLADLQDGRRALDEITGRRTSDDVLNHIFARFCIGK